MRLSGGLMRLWKRTVDRYTPEPSALILRAIRSQTAMATASATGVSSALFPMGIIVIARRLANPGAMEAPISSPVVRIAGAINIERRVTLCRVVFRSESLAGTYFQP